MHEIRNVKNNIIVCPNNTKKYIQKNTKELLKCKFYTVEDMIRKLTFSISDISVYKVASHFSLDIDVAKMYVDNLIYLNYIKQNEKTKILKNIFAFLESNNLIIYDPNFEKMLLDYSIQFIGYTYLPKILIHLLSNSNYELIEIEEYSLPNNIKIFNNDDDELLYLAESILTLVSNGVDIKKIKVVYNENVSKLRRIFDFYNIPVNYNKKIYIKEIISIRHIINDDYLNYDYINTLDITLKNEIINIINEARKTIFNDNEFIKIFKYILENHKILVDKLQNAVEIIDLTEVLNLEDNYIFIPCFSLGSYPTISMDTKYFKDSEVINLPFDTSVDMNNHNYNSVIKVIKSNNNIHLSHHEQSNGDRKYLSNIINDLKIKEIVNCDFSHSNFSNTFNKILYSMHLDQYTKYTVINKGLPDLNKTYNIPYLEYNNSFTGLKDGTVSKAVNNNLKLSYTSLNKFYECKFAFYIQRILKIDIYKETFPLFIGTLFHEVLKDSTSEYFSIDKKWNEVVSNSKYILSNKEKFLLIKLKEELVTIIDIINEQNKIIKYKDMMFEEEVKYSFNLKEHNTDVSFTGVIDKLYYKTIDEAGITTTYITVVDYKTGKLDIDLKLVEYGLSLQLPIYLHLAKKINKFDNVKVYGFFLQNILSTEIVSKTEEEYIKTKKDNLKLRGYIVDSVSELFEFDPTLANSEIIKGLRQKKDKTFYASSKVLTEEFLNKLDILVNDKITSASNDILNGDFRINPKVINNKNISCRYCSFSDVCYHTGKDNVYIALEVNKDEMD